MKKIYFFALLLFSMSTKAQIGPYLRAIISNNNVYYTKLDLKVQRFQDIDGNVIEPKVAYTLRPGKNKIRYRIAGIDGKYTIIRLLPRLKDNGDQTITYSKDVVADSDNPIPYAYAVLTTDFDLNQKIVMSDKIIGTPLVFPFKLRPQDVGDGATLTSEITIGYTFGLRLKLGDINYKQNYITFIPYGFGVGAAKYFYQKADQSYSAKEDNVAVTYLTTGIMFTSNKINFGIFAGKDAMIDKKNDWAYQGKWWFSFGLGYKFKTD